MCSALAITSWPWRLRARERGLLSPSPVLVCRVALGYTIRTQGRAHDGREWQKNCVAMDGEAASASGLVFPTAAAGGEQNMRELVTLPLPGTEGNAIHYHSLLAEIGSSVGLRNHHEHAVSSAPQCVRVLILLLLLLPEP